MIGFTALQSKSALESVKTRVSHRKWPSLDRYSATPPSQRRFTVSRRTSPQLCRVPPSQRRFAVVTTNRQQEEGDSTYTERVRYRCELRDIVIKQATHVKASVKGSLS